MERGQQGRGEEREGEERRGEGRRGEGRGGEGRGEGCVMGECEHSHFQEGMSKKLV